MVLPLGLPAVGILEFVSSNMDGYSAGELFASRESAVVSRYLSRYRAVRKLFRLAWWERVRLVEMGRYGDA